MTKSLEISDLAGLKEPITKLIDVVSKGVGILYEPRNIKKMADAKAYEIEKISLALRRAEVCGQVTYDKNNLKLSMDLINGELKEVYTDRLLYKEMKRQDNTDKIILGAYQELEKVDYASNEDIDDDWITRFFRIAEDISSEDMQVLWGKILAGEIITPNTYSLRTLEILKNLNKKEAELFSKVGNLAIKTSIATFIIGDKELLESEFGVDLSDILLLDELNLIDSQGLKYELKENNEKGSSRFLYANKSLHVIKDASPKHAFPIYKFTKCGEELLNFIEQDYNQNYISKFGSIVKKQGITITSYDIVKREGNEYWCSEVGLEL